jgi:DNA helicase-2/ATP-dependent DNA helicase PcrA
MFHAWVEQFFESPAMLPIEDVDVLGDWSYRDTQIPVLQENFRNGPFAHRTPFAIEKPFSFTLNSRTIQGRIDAIFVEPHDSPYEYLVVDWKTGETSNPLQLELYRHAWAIATGVDPARIKAEFYHVATNRIVSLEAPMDLETLVAQLEI